MYIQVETMAQNGARLNDVCNIHYRKIKRAKKGDRSWKELDIYSGHNHGRLYVITVPQKPMPFGI